MPCFDSAFFVFRVVDQSADSALPFMTRRGKVSFYVSTWCDKSRRRLTVGLDRCGCHDKMDEELHSEELTLEKN